MEKSFDSRFKGIDPLKKPKHEVPRVKGVLKETAMKEFIWDILKVRNFPRKKLTGYYSKALMIAKKPRSKRHKTGAKT